MNIKPERDSRVLMTISPLVKAWFLDVSKIQASIPASTIELIAAYFKDDAYFPNILAKWVTNEIVIGDVNAVRQSINMLAMAIAYEKLQQEILAHLFAATPNSH